MFTRKSGILALVLSAFVLGACDDDETLPPPPPDEDVIVQVAPDPVPALSVGQTVQLVGIVSNATNTGVSWSSSNNAVATVSATGLVTAVSPGITVVTATSAEDANARDAVTIQVLGGGTGSDGQPAITIASVTQGGTNIPVNPSDVEGTIDVTVNVEIPAGFQGANAVEIDILDAATGAVVGEELCRQTFTAGGTGFDLTASVVPQTVVCSVNTAELDDDGRAILRNGNYRIRAQIEDVAGLPLATATSQPYVFNNDNVINGIVTTSNGSAIGGDGLQWHGGDVTVTLRPAIFSGNSATGDLSNISVSMISSGPGTSWFINCDATDATPNCATRTATRAATRVEGTNNTWTVVFPADEDFTAADDGSGNVEDQDVRFAAAGSTVGGNNFVGTTRFGFEPANGGPSTDVVFSGTNPLRLDNMGPRIVEFDVTEQSLGCDQSACFINDDFLFEPGFEVEEDNGFFETVDFGVDSETTTFDVGTPAQFDADAGFADDVESGADERLEETETPNLVVRATSTDALGNSTTEFATDDPDNGSDDVDDAQFIGIDRTAPEITDVDSATGAEDEGTDPFADDAAESFTIEFVDEAGTAGAGPSGFGDEPLDVTVVLYNADEPTGEELEEGTDYTVVCGGNFCTLTLEDGEGATEGYLDVSMTVRDASAPGGNVSTAETIIWLDDETPPQVAGVTATSTIVGNQPATFSADMSDNVEIGDILASIGYLNDETGDIDYYAHEGRREVESYGVPLDADPEVNQEFTFTPFIYSLEQVDAGVPSADANFASRVNFAVRDVAGVELDSECPIPAAGDNATNETCVQRENNNIEVNVDAGNDLENFEDTDEDLEQWILNSVDADDEDGSVIEAEARGPQGTFANPFDFVNFYYFDTTLQRWIRIEGSVSVRAIDDDTQNVRRWIYELETEDDLTGVDIRAIGVQDGRGLVSNTEEGV